MPRIGRKSKELNYFIEDFMMNCKMKGLGTKTMDSYEKTLKLFGKFLEEEFQIVEVDEDHIKEYLKFTETRGKYSFVANDKTIAINHPEVSKDLGKKVTTCTINNYRSKLWR